MAQISFGTPATAVGSADGAALNCLQQGGGDNVVGGMVVVVNPHLPRQRVGTTIVPKPPVLRWLLRWVPRRWRPRWYRIGAPIEQESFFVVGGKLFCTPAGLRIIQAHVPRRTA